ncbi:alpha/beta fold hydrolase [Marinobacter sp. C2H3]|uniref:alpha/beta fold hydrolase n=1 Tax=Marinobacter sp. C2H3 TaxID=3119003 RepID=UPI00300F367A
MTTGSAAADHRLTLADGRTLAYTDTGDPQGYPLVFAHGMPGSRLEGRLFDEQARRYGFRILAPDRPGIGGSTYQPGRRLLDYPDDVRQLLDALGLNRFTHLGWSSGGSRTVACAYALADRMDRGLCLSGYTHFAEFPGRQTLIEGTRWPGPRLASLSPTLVRWAVRLIVRLSRWYPGIYLREAQQLVSDDDRRILALPGVEAAFREDQRLCLASGGNAIATDLLTELGHWGFSLDRVPAPIEVYQGEDDPFVSPDYARHLAGALPQARLTLLPGIGHLYPLDPAFQARLFASLNQALQRERAPVVQNF